MAPPPHQRTSTNTTDKGTHSHSKFSATKHDVTPPLEVPACLPATASPLLSGTRSSVRWQVLRHKPNLGPRDHQGRNTISAGTLRTTTSPFLSAPRPPSTVTERSFFGNG